MASQPPADPTTPRPADVDTPDVDTPVGAPPAGTQRAAADPGSGGEKVLFIGGAGVVLAAVGLLLSTEVGPIWSTASISLGVIGLLLTIIATVMGLSGGRRNAATAAGGMIAVAAIFLILAIVRAVGGDTSPGDDGTDMDTTPDAVLHPPIVDQPATE